jgi:predicted nucleic acid-binding protein
VQVLLDTNVLLDVLARRPGLDASKRVLDWCQAPGRGAWITWPTVATLAYLLARAGTDAASVRAKLGGLRYWVSICPARDDTLARALSFPMNDFEDALQVAFAEAVALDVIVTRNLADFGGSLVPALAPEEFLSRYASPD